MSTSDLFDCSDFREVIENDFICSLDDRYAKDMKKIKAGKYRLFVQCKIEYEWAKYVCREFKCPNIKEIKPFNFDQEIITRIKEIEKKTKHDVKAIELTVGEFFFPQNLRRFVHIGMTSEDTNSIAVIMTMRENTIVISDYVGKLLKKIYKLSSMMDRDGATYVCARTHGQKAIPTTWATRINTIAGAINRNLDELNNNMPNMVKFGGAINGLDCIQTMLNTQFGINKRDARKFVNKSPLFSGKHLCRDEFAFQTPLYDHHAKHFQTISRIALLLQKLAMDLWDGYKTDHFTLNVAKDQVGSYVMCQKINPIGLENGAGNMKKVVTMCHHMSTELQCFILERDIRDSTQLRDIPMIYGYFVLGIKSIMRDISNIRLAEYNRFDNEVVNNGQVFSAQVMTALNVILYNQNNEETNNEENDNEETNNETNKEEKETVYEKVRKMTQGKTFTIVQFYITFAPIFSKFNRIDDLRHIMKMGTKFIPYQTYMDLLPTVTIATSNKGKQDEYRKYFTNYGCDIDFIDYTGKEPIAKHSIVVNYKACYMNSIINDVKEIYSEFIIVEDTALEVYQYDQENNKQVINKFGINIKHAIDELKDYIGYHADFKLIMAYYDENVRGVRYCEKIVKGMIVESKGDNGFGFDSMFKPIGSDKTLGEMTCDEKEEYNPRRMAVNEFINNTNKYIGDNLLLYDDVYFRWNGEFQDE